MVCSYKVRRFNEDNRHNDAAIWFEISQILSWYLKIFENVWSKTLIPILFPEQKTKGLFPDKVGQKGLNKKKLYKIKQNRSVFW